MMRSLKVVMLSSALLLSPAAIAADLLVNTFLQSRPFKGVELELNGKLVGETGALGEAKATLDAGRHELRLLKNGIPLADYDFDLAAGENAELSITFTDFDSAPDFALETYAEGQGVDADATGTIGGDVMSADGLPIAGATVGVAEGESTTLTNESGVFELVLPRGAYTLQISHPDYQPIEKAGFRVVANVGLATSVKLNAIGGGSVPALSASADEEVVVLGTYKPVENAVDLERFSTVITDAISIDDLLRSGDGDVAAALKRLVGVSVTDGRYAVVRGLDGRYIAATLNDSLMPGTDPFRRDVQLDLFPSDILQGLEIQKTFSAELPGDTTGGVIKMTTRGMQDEYVNKLSLSLGYVDGVTGDDFGSYEGGDTDFLGFDDGLRELPPAIDSATKGGTEFNVCQVQGQQNCVQQDEAGRLATLLPNILNPTTENADPNFGIAYALGNVFQREMGEVGLYGSLSYDRGSKARQEAFIDDNSTESTYTRDQGTTALSGYFVAGLVPDSISEYLSKTIILRSTEDTVEVESGRDKDEGRELDRVLLEWEERQFIAQQFSGSHSLFGGEHSLSWRAGVSQTRVDAPDRRSYLYINNSLALSNFERSYLELVEDGLDIGVDYELPIQITSTINSRLKAGVLGNIRDREVDLIRIGVRRGSGPNIALNQDPETLFSPENFLNDSFQLRQAATVTDSYDGEQESMSAYVSSETDFGEAISVSLGIRSDNFSQTLEFPNSPGSESELDSKELLPTILATYRYSEALQFRAGYAATVSRPNLTELAPSVFYDERGREFRGCPTCVESTIDNFDIRAEYYFDNQDSVSVALFTKEIDDPLETALEDGSGSASRSLTFRNADAATVSGVELDGNLTLLDGVDHFLTLGANLSFIDSKVELDSLSQLLEANADRELQGQSPFLANMRVSWDYNPFLQKVTLVLNYFDDRIDRISRGQPPIKEAGRIIVGVNYEKEIFSSSKISFRIKNLLDESVEYTQGGRVIEGYKEGMEMSAGYSVSF